MLTYVSSVLGAVVLGVMIEVLMPSGDMQKYIRGMYSVFIIFILLTPITKLFSMDFDMSSIMASDTVNVDERYVDYITQARSQALAQYLQEKLSDEGIFGVEIKISYINEDFEYFLDTITINISNLVIDSKYKHINKYDIIKDNIKKYVDIKEAKIIFDE